MKKLKVLYLTIPSYFDLEISLIRELSLKVDVKVLMFLSPSSMHSSAFSVDELDSRCAIINFSDYKGLEKYNSFIKPENWYVANNPDNSILSCIMLASLIKKFYNVNNFSFIHNTSFSKEGLFLLPFIWRSKNTLMTKHDPIPHDEPGVLGKIRLWGYHKAYKNLLFLSDSLTTEFCDRYNYNKNNIFYSYLSVYDFLLTYENNPIINGDYILFFGRITEYKGVDLLIDSYLESEAYVRGVKLVIAGKGNVKHDISTLDPNIVFINKYIENDELASLIANCNYVVLPYITATQSGCVMSAFAFNKPILATRVGDLPNEVIDNVTGLTCEPNNQQSLTNAINLMFRKKTNQLSKNINQRYFNDGPRSWGKAATAIVETYNEIII